MSDLNDNITGEHAQPLYMWEVGYEHAVDSMRTDTADTDHDRKLGARFAALMFASAQARAMCQIEKHLAELVAIQRGHLAQSFVEKIGDAMTGGPFVEGGAK